MNVCYGQVFVLGQPYRKCMDGVETGRVGAEIFPTGTFRCHFSGQQVMISIDISDFFFLVYYAWSL